MSDQTPSLLGQLSSELAELGRQVAPLTAIVTGQTRDFSEASGSGWLYDPTHLVTNFHVIDGLEPPIHIRMAGHPRIAVQVAGSDPYTDLAVLTLPERVAAGLPVRVDPPRLG